MPRARLTALPGLSLWLSTPSYGHSSSPGRLLVSRAKTCAGQSSIYSVIVMSLITRIKNTVVDLLDGAGVAAVIGLLVLLPVTLFVFCSWIVWEIAGLFGGLGFGWCMLITLLIGPAIGLLKSLLAALARPFKRSSQA